GAGQGAGIQAGARGGRPGRRRGTAIPPVADCGGRGSLALRGDWPGPDEVETDDPALARRQTEGTTWQARPLRGLGERSAVNGNATVIALGVALRRVSPRAGAAVGLRQGKRDAGAGELAGDVPALLL